MDNRALRVGTKVRLQSARLLFKFLGVGEDSFPVSVETLPAKRLARPAMARSSATCLISSGDIFGLTLVSNDQTPVCQYCCGVLIRGAQARVTIRNARRDTKTSDQARVGRAAGVAEWAAVAD